MNKQAMELAFKHWIDNFDGGLVVTNKVIWEAAWNAALKETVKQQDDPDVMRVTVDTEGVRFGDCWMSHEAITGCSAEQLNTGSCGVIGKQYMRWVNAMLSTAPQYTGEKE